MGSIIDIAAARRVPMRHVASDELDAVLAEDVPEQLTVLLLWETGCTACEEIRQAIARSPASFRQPGLRWLQGDARADPWIVTRFGLHGIPAFLFFRGRRVLGRVTGWPGTDAFVRIVAQQLWRSAQPAGPRHYASRDAGAPQPLG